MDNSDSFYFTVPTDNADCNYFTDFVKTRIGNFSDTGGVKIHSVQEFVCRTFVLSVAPVFATIPQNKVHKELANGIVSL